MKFERKDHISTLPISTAMMLNHLRIGSELEEEAEPLVHAAAMEIEAYCDLALLTQTIVATQENKMAAACGIFQLPVGPVFDGGIQSIEIIIDGEPVPYAGEYILTAGRYPELRLKTQRSCPTRITYTAGYGVNDTELPPDLALAIADQAAQLFDRRGADSGRQGLSLAASRICARYRKVTV